MNNFGYLVDEDGSLVTRDGRKIIDYDNLTTEGDFPPLLTYSGSEFRIKDIMGKLIRDEITGHAVLKYQKSTN
jgi:hypothetical protein